jgi:hypothetical protein
VPLCSRNARAIPPLLVSPSLRTSRPFAKGLILAAMRAHRTTEREQIVAGTFTPAPSWRRREIDQGAGDAEGSALRRGLRVKPQPQAAKPDATVTELHPGGVRNHDRRTQTHRGGKAALR